MNLFDPESFEQIPGQLAMDTDAPALPERTSLTTREKRERKAERLRGWADGRDAKGDAAHSAVQAIADRIPFGQPILVGHYSERGARADQNRMHSGMDRACENWAKAGDMRSRAENIEAANRQAIYSDDADAVEQLTAKIARLEAERDNIKARNAEFKRAHKAELKAETSAYARDRMMPFPGYHLTNLSANIRRLQKRLEELQKPERGRWLVSRYDGSCRKCEAETAKGDRVLYFKRAGAVECEACASL